MEKELKQINQNQQSKKFRIIPCKYCKRGRVKVHKNRELGSKIIADKCIYCGGKGFIREEIGKDINTTNNSEIERRNI